MWAYYNNADEVELFINGKSQGIKKKIGDDLHVMWRVQYEAGTVKAVSRKNGKVVLTKEIKTAGTPAKIILEADRKVINSKANEFCFVTVKILDKEGNFVPDANNLINFTVTGGNIAGVDNGSQTDLTSFKANKRKAFNGLCLAILQSSGKPGAIQLKATIDGLPAAMVTIEAK
jgi:beta-galactosidase